MKDTDNEESAGETWDYLHRTLGNEATVGGDQPLSEASFWASGKETVARISQLVGGLGDKDVLDYGCGRGRLACWTQRRCKTLTCADGSAWALKQLPANLAEYSVASDPTPSIHQVTRLRQLPLRASFDVIYAWHVVFHLTPLQAFGFIHDAFQRLRPGGSLVFNHSNFFHPFCVDILRQAAQQGEWMTGEFPYAPMSSRVLVHFATEVMGFVQATVDDSTALQPAIVCVKS